MTDNTVPNSVPDPLENESSMEHEVPKSEAPAPSETSAESDWDPVQFPGQIPLEEEESSDSPPPAPQPTVESTVLPPSNSAESPPNTNELIQLIQDLNHCNDALLNRISNLEESLEQSQAALQTEIERNQGLANTDAGTVHQQVAQLLGELDVANDGLRRTTMHNEALQAELDVSQQRIAQLERECTLLQQRFNEKSSAFQQAEQTCRDLKSRLHRQQRYTLQFKAALEKCLNMTAEQNSTGGNSNHGVFSDAEGTSQPVAMPKSQHIQPWSTQGENGHQHNFSLNDLLRGLKTPHDEPNLSQPTVTPQQTQSIPSASEKASDPEAEALLWKDLARVTEPPSTADYASPIGQANDAMTAQGPDSLHPSDPSAQSVSSSGDTNSSTETSPQELAFTEPSPWGAPLPSSDPSPSPQPPAPSSSMPAPSMLEDKQVETEKVYPAEASASDSPRQEYAPKAPITAHTTPRESALPGYLQGTTQSQTASPSPVVYPLRSPKKRKSLAAVELPSFGRPARRR